MKVTVRFMNYREITVDVSDSATGNDLKGSVYKKTCELWGKDEKPTVSQQRLTWKGTCLSDELTLTEQGVVEGHPVVCFLKLSSHVQECSVCK